MSNTHEKDLAARLQFALDSALAASELILGYYQNPELAILSKGDTTPVTAADRGAEELIRARIEKVYPDDGILGEEHGEKAGKNAYRWILDPVDGTKSFIHGVPLFGTLIGLEFEREVVVGVCRFPALSEVVYAAKGSGAWWKKGNAEPQRARVTQTAKYSEALFLSTTISGWERLGARKTFDKLMLTAGLHRGWGDCFSHMLVATGRADVAIDPYMNPWDAAALKIIVEEAGGHYVDFDGNPTIYSTNGLSVNAALRDEVLTLLKQQ